MDFKCPVPEIKEKQPVALPAELEASEALDDQTAPEAAEPIVMPDPVATKSAVSQPAPPKAPSQAEITLAIKEAQREFAKQKAIDDAKNAQEAAELAKLEAELAEIEAEERRQLRLVEMEVKPGALKRIASKGEKVGRDHDPDGATDKAADPEMIARNKAIAKKRLNDMFETGECYYDQAQVMVLKPTDRIKVDMYMMAIGDIPEGAESPDDIFIFDGDRTGVAQYIGYRKDFERAMTEANIQVKKYARADELDKLYYLMKYCRTFLRECGIKHITHHVGTDVPVEAMAIVEELQMALTELRVR
jgi:hypothetical protein